MHSTDTATNVRVARHRDRKRRGALMLTIEVADPIGLTDFLLQARLIGPGEADDKQAVSRGTARLLDLIAGEGRI